MRPRSLAVRATAFVADRGFATTSIRAPIAADPIATRSYYHELGLARGGDLPAIEPAGHREPGAL